MSERLILVEQFVEQFSLNFHWIPFSFLPKNLTQQVEGPEYAAKPRSNFLKAQNVNCTNFGLGSEGKV